MKLYLSRNSTTETTLCDGPISSSGSGLPVYHIHTTETGKLRSRDTITISRIAPECALNPLYNSGFLSGKKKDIEDHTKYDGGVVPFARLYYKDWKGGPRIEYNGEEMKVDEFMPPKGILQWKRTFSAPDGRAYTWRNGRYVTISHEDRDVEVARFHDSIFNFIRRPNIEIQPGYEDTADMIVMTWVFIETLTRDIATRGAAAGAAASSVAGVAAAV